MNATEVASLARVYVDEQDLSFLPNATVSALLKVSYGEFRRLVANIDPNIYTVTADFNLSNVISYDLGGSTNAVRVLGPSPTTTRMERLVRLDFLNGDGTINTTFRAASNMNELRTQGYGIGFFNGMFLLQGSTIYFAYPQTGTFRLTYMPQSTVDWTKIAPSDTEFIDDLSDFHDLISLLFCTHYGVLNNGLDVADILGTRKQELADFLSYGRNPGANDHVVREW